MYSNSQLEVDNMTYEIYGRGGSIGEQKAYKKNNKTKFISGLGEMFLLGKADTKDEAKAIASGWKKSLPTSSDSSDG